MDQLLHLAEQRAWAAEAQEDTARDQEAQAVQTVLVDWVAAEEAEDLTQPAEPVAAAWL
jgi:hypothetical protein